MKYLELFKCRGFSVCFRNKLVGYCVDGLLHLVDRGGVLCKVEKLSDLELGVHIEKAGFLHIDKTVYF